MRQVKGLLEVIGRAHLIEHYKSISSYATVKGVQIPSLDEFLSLTLGEEHQGFDDDTDKKLEEFALKRLNERKAQARV